MEDEASSETTDFEPDASDDGDDEVEIIIGSALGVVAIVAVLTFGLIQYQRTQESSSGNAKPNTKKSRMKKSKSSSGTGKPISNSAEGDMEAGTSISTTYDNPLVGMRSGRVSKSY